MNALEYKVSVYCLVLELKSLIHFCIMQLMNASFHPFQEHLHYDVVKSADPELKKATIQINVYKQHRQTIQVNSYYFHPKVLSILFRPITYQMLVERGFKVQTV